ncbi:prolyl oligopeptidase family serine peptidase [Paenibacillus pabuli]|uniref:prolyl oligopeptidase family serine peptidase n=1 Tax=Paenibacillus pabuli TaxID=1472 RepID=UPI003CE82E3E
MKIENWEKVNHEFVNNRLKITKTLLIGPFTNPKKNDFLNTEINNILYDKNQLIVENQSIMLSDGNSYPVYYYDQLDDDSEIDLLSIGVKENFKDKDDRILMFFNIFCDEDKKILLYKTLNFCKIWVDGNLVLHGDNYDGRGEVILPLCSGNNCIMMEYNSTCNKGLVIFDITGKEDFFELEYILDYSLKNASNEIDIVQESVICLFEEEYEMLVIPKDFIEVDLNQLILTKIYDCNHDLVHSFEANFLNPIKISAQNLRFLNTFYLTIEFTYQVRDKVFKKSSQILINSPKLLIQNYCQQFAKLKSGLNIDECINFEYRAFDVLERFEEEIKYASDLKEIICDIEILKDLLIHYSKGLSLRDYIIQYQRAIQIYYVSSIDNSIEKYWIALPHDYSSDLNYPLLYHLPIRRYAQPFIYEVINQMLDDKDRFIFVSPTGRGTTLGSYIGEASFLEVNSLVNQNWEVDTDRIYSYGNSNGGFGTWAIAQTHPELFRGILTSGGGPYLKNLKNVSHMSVINVCGTSDQNYYSHFKKVNGIIDRDFVDYVSYEIDNLNHFDTELFTFSPLLIRRLMHRSYYSNNKIYYRTERIRHNKTKYIVINYFKENVEFAEVIIDLSENNKIKVSTQNISEFTLNISRLPLKYIVIDNIKYDIPEKIDLSKITFRLQNSQDSFAMMPPKSYSNYQSLGMGIMDIYMDRFQVLLPMNVDSFEKATLEAVANAFTNPITKTWSPIVHVKYSTYYYDYLNLSDLNTNSIVLIPTCINEEIISALNDSVGFEFNEKGYKTSQGFQEEKFVLVAITRQKVHPTQKLLFIFYNDSGLLNKSIFSRSIILGSYVNGVGKYFNKDIIIYTQKGMKAFNRKGI